MGIPRIEAALSRISTGGDALAVASELRKLLPAAVARWAAEQYDLRQRAAGRLHGAEHWCLSRRALEQATPTSVATWRARRVAERAPGARVLDATAGLGSDAAALAAAGLDLLAVDRDAELAHYCAHNLAVAGARARVLRADAERPPLTPEARKETLLVLDPDRRADGRRSLDPARWSPGWSAVLGLVASFPGGCLKLAPGVDPARCPLPRDVAASWTWTSRGGELVEAALWFGSLAGFESPAESGGGSRGGTGARSGSLSTPSAGALREAVATADRGAPARLVGTPLELPALTPDEAAHIRWFAEPDPSVIRADLVERLAELAGMRPLAPGLAYLGSHEPPRDLRELQSDDSAASLLRVWRVQGSAPADRKQVRVLLGEHGVGPLTVKKRGHPDSAEVLARRFRGPGERRGLLAVSRLGKAHRVWLLEG